MVEVDQASNWSVSIYGAGTIPTGSSRITVTRPLVVLYATTTGIEIRVRPRWVERLFSLFSFEVDSVDEIRWTTSWEELSLVELAWRSVLFTRRDGSRCRFVGNVVALKPMLMRPSIEIRVVRSTLKATFTVNNGIHR